VREVTFQVGVGGKASVEICRDQECVTRNPYESIEYLWLRVPRPIKCAFDIYIGGIHHVPAASRQDSIKVVYDSVAKPSPPEIATYIARFSLTRQG
jgi:hypothetical protein